MNRDHSGKHVMNFHPCKEMNQVCAMESLKKRKSYAMELDIHATNYFRFLIN